MSTMQPAVKIEEVGLQDALLVQQITVGSHLEYEGILVPPPAGLSESIEDVEQEIVDGGAAIAWVGETPVGAVRFLPGEGFLEIGRLSVLPEYRFVRVGTSLVDFAEAVARHLERPALIATVRTALPGVITFFEKIGFEPGGADDEHQNPQRPTVMLKKDVG